MPSRARRRRSPGRRPRRPPPRRRARPPGAAGTTPPDLISWNVNGTRAAWKKGLPEFVAASSPDVLCVQETKIQEDQLTPEIRDLGGYRSYWSVAAA